MTRWAILQCSASACAVNAFLLLPSLYWVTHDRSVWPWDQAWYGEVSVDLWYTLLHQPGQWGVEMLQAFRSKAPGVAWVGQFFVPVGQFIGSIETGLLFSIVLTQFGTLILAYEIGQDWFPEQPVTPLLGSLMVASSPLFIAMNHQYLAEPLQLFAITYFYLIAVKCRSWVRLESFGHLFLATGLALLAKVTSPLYCFAPVGIAIYEMFRSHGRQSGSTGASLRQNGLLLVVGATIFGSAVSWYLKNFSTVRDFVKLASSSEIALDYGTKNSFLNKFLYWLAATQKSVIMPEVLLTLMMLIGIGMSFSLAIGFTSPSEKCALSRFDLLAFGALLHVTVVLIVFSLSINEENRYLLPLLPSLLILFFWCMTFVRTRLGILLVLVILVAQWTFVHAQALGYISPNYRISYWVQPYKLDPQPRIEVKGAVELTCDTQRAYRYNITGIELPWLNANSLSFYTAKERLESKIRCYYTSLGYAEKDVTRAWDRLETLNIAHFISLAEPAHPNPPNFLNQASIPILNKIKADERFAPKPFDSNLNVIVFQRR